MAAGTDGLPLTYTARLRRRREAAERTWAFEFEKPEGFTFKAGQFTDVTLRSLKEMGMQGATHTFSIASAPHEDLLMVATRMRDSAFKQALASLPLGTEVTISGGRGDLVLHEGSGRPAVILAGGIGITPFRSIVVDAARRALPHRILLFYSNRRPEDAPFLEELQLLQRSFSNYQLVATMTQMEKSRRPWTGERGPINRAMLTRNLGAGPSPIYYLAGPPSMVYGLHEMLNQAGADDSSIKSEEFYGYD